MPKYSEKCLRIYPSRKLADLLEWVKMQIADGFYECKPFVDFDVCGNVNVVELEAEHISLPVYPSCTLHDLVGWANQQIAKGFITCSPIIGYDRCNDVDSIELDADVSGTK